MNPLRPLTVDRIAESMLKNGWQGRPLLVEEGLHGRLFAWTGSHRIEAAKAAGLKAVPCRVISRAESEGARDRLPDSVEYQSL